MAGRVPPGRMPGTVRTAQVDEIHAGAAGIGLTVTVGMPHGAAAACGAMFGFAAIAPPVMTATSVRRGQRGARGGGSPRSACARGAGT
ncbi:hypothetical protein [Nocardia thailandica]